MNRISCMDALNRAITKTEEVLFKPFDFVKWIVFGFSAWLAFMGETIGKGIEFMPVNFGDIFNVFLHKPSESSSQGIQKNIASEFLSSISPPHITGSSLNNIFSIKTFIIIMLLTGLIFAAVVILGFLLSWLKARFEFIFLDNILTRSPDIARPWRENSSRGNSVFIFRVLANIIGIMILLTGLAVMGVLAFAWIKQCIAEKTFSWPDPGIAISLAVCVLIITIISLFFTILFFLFKHLAIPVMYKKNIKSLPAIINVYSLFRKHPWAFSKYIMLVCILNIGVKLILFIICICTCCTGFIVLSIPYLSTLIVLPALVFFRFFSLEFLAQIDDSCNLFIENN